VGGKNICAKRRLAGRRGRTMPRVPHTDGEFASAPIAEFADAPLHREEAREIGSCHTSGTHRHSCSKAAQSSLHPADARAHEPEQHGNLHTRGDPQAATNPRGQHPGRRWNAKYRDPSDIDPEEAERKAELLAALDAEATKRKPARTSVYRVMASTSSISRIRKRERLPLAPRPRA